MAARKRPWAGSEVKLTVKLPRVVLPNGRVGHVLISGRNIWDLMIGGGNRVSEVACHKVDNYDIIDRRDRDFDGRHWHCVYWATKDLPTCRACERALRSLVL